MGKEKGKGYKLKRKVTLPSVRKQRFETFKEFWSKLDEDTQEIIAGGLYALNHPPVGRADAISLIKDTFDDYRAELLIKLSRFTENV